MFVVLLVTLVGLGLVLSFHWAGGAGQRKRTAAAGRGRKRAERGTPPPPKSRPPSSVVRCHVNTVDIRFFISSIITNYLIFATKLI